MFFIIVLGSFFFVGMVFDDIFKNYICVSVI